MSGRARNNLARLPQPVRYRICQMLDDGETYEAIRSEPEVAAELETRGLALHSTSFLAYRESAEYRSYCETRRRVGEEIEERRMAAFLVAQEGGADAIANAASFELLRIVMEKLKGPNVELEPKEVSAISGALAAYQRNRITEKRSDQERDFAAKESEYQSRIAELERKLSDAATNNRAAGISPEALKEIEDRIGML